MLCCFSARCASLWRRQPSTLWQREPGAHRRGLRQVQVHPRPRWRRLLRPTEQAALFGICSAQVLGRTRRRRRRLPLLLSRAQAMKHFVPIAADLSDLVERLHWLKSHDEEARDVRVVRRSSPGSGSAPEAIDGYTYALLVGLAELQRAQPEARDGGVGEFSCLIKAAKAKRPKWADLASSTSARASP